jgi:hypothetical protein
MRQTHPAGERLFVDYAGDGVPFVIDRLTGEIRMAQIFVGPREHNVGIVQAGRSSLRSVKNLAIDALNGGR